MALRELTARRAGLLGSVTRKVEKIRGYIIGTLSDNLEPCEVEVRKLLDIKSKFDEAHEAVVRHSRADKKIKRSCQESANRATHSVVSVLNDFEQWCSQDDPTSVTGNASVTSGDSSSGTVNVQHATLEMLGKLHDTITSMKNESVSQAVKLALTEQQQQHELETRHLHEQIENLSKQLDRVSLLHHVSRSTLSGQDTVGYSDTDMRQENLGVRGHSLGSSVLHSTGHDQVPPRPSFGRGRARGRYRPSSITPDPEPVVGKSNTETPLAWNFSEAATAMKDMLSTTLAQHSTIVANLQAPKVKLKQFSGDPLEYMRFISAFDDLVHNAYDNNRARLLVLLENCTDQARVAIESCSHMNAEEGYAEARRILKRRFGADHVITQAWIDRIMSYPNVVEGTTLETYAADVEACRNCLRTLGSLAELECIGTLQKVVFKLPLHLRNRWRKLLRLSRKEGNSKADLLVQLLREAADDDCDPAFSESVITKIRGVYEASVTPKANRVHMSGKRAGVFAGQEAEEDDDIEAEIHAVTRASCAACRSGQHFTSRCKNYRDMNPLAKLEFVRAKKLCLLCLADTHVVANCPLPWKCQDKTCGLRHHTSLHASFESAKPRGPIMTGPKPPESAWNQLDEIPEGECTTYETDEGSAYAVMCAGNLPIAKVTVRFGEKTINTYALLDSGATITLCRKNIMESLGLPVVGRKRMTIGTISGKSEVDSDVVSMHVSEFSNRIALPLHGGMVVSRINVSLRGLAPLDAIQKFPHLRGLRFHRGEENHIGLLIGQNNAHLIDPKEVIRGGYFDPYAVGTPLGWVLFGNTKEDFGRGDRPMPPHSGRPSPWQPSRMVHATELAGGDGGESEEEDADAYVNFLDTMQTDTVSEWDTVLPFAASQQDRSEDDVCEFVNCTCDDTELMSVLEKLAAVDSVPEADTLTKDERKVLELWERELQFVDGHVMIPIPFKSDPPELINNFVAAYRALIHLGNQLLKDKTKLKQYKDAVLAYFDRGYAEIVKDDTPSLTKFVWYMLHHGVDHPRKPGVTRVVKHGGAKYKGFCLNSAAYQGPNLMNNLSEVLTRFRQYKVGTTSDIEGMFNQVLVPENQRDYSRFLFWEDGDPTKRVIVCRMKTHIFGTVWAPAAANFALKKMAELEERPLVKEAIDKEFYVDDWPGSQPSSEEAVSQYFNVREALARGGFNLTKLASNSRTVLKSVPSELRVKALGKLDMDVDVLPHEVLLGQCWFPDSDEFGYKVAMEPRPFTRRGMTSCIASIFDPLGLIAPFILPAKLLMQKSSKSGSGWDEELLDGTSDQWAKWLEQLPQIENFRLRRWFGCTKGSTQYIHMFSDACERSYGAAAYLAVSRGKENVSTLVTSKSRVSPPSKLTIPKMEMAGAVLAVKLMKVVKKMFGVFISGYYFWIDSTIVLILIRKDPDTLRTFMGNRVAYIQAETDISQWGHVAGKLNPADISSRGEGMAALNSSCLWKEGPEFLKSDPESWNKMKLEVLELKEVKPELKNEKPIFCGVITTADDSEALVATLEESLMIKSETLPTGVFRTPDKIERDTATRILSRYSTWIKAVRFAVVLAKYIAWLVQKVKTGKKCIPVKEIMADEICREEINLISWEQSMLLDSSVTKETWWRSLLPFWEDVWRVGGRCQYSDLDDEVKHPIILPRDGLATDLLIRDAHIRSGHGGPDRTLVELRGRFWILGGKPTVKKFTDPCVICKRLKGVVLQQQMAPLPQERLAPRKPPFTYSGVDLFGPIEVSIKRSTVKRYGAIFTCFNTRAIHLEPVEDLSASAFLDTIERFCMRKTRPVSLRSDNGTNFVRCNKEIEKATAMLTSPNLQRSLANNRITWVFNTPAASHQGGVWERLIRSCRQIMMSLLSERPLTDARFHTVLCITEGIMNSRPLTRLTDDVRDLDPLTPGHFTGGGRITSAVSLASCGDTLRQDWKLSQSLANRYWDMWIASYLPLLQKRPKWIAERNNLKKGELVLIASDQCGRFDWPLGRVIEVHAGRDGLVRNVTLRTGNGMLKRPVQKVVRLELDAP